MAIAEIRERVKYGDDVAEALRGQTDLVKVKFGKQANADRKRLLAINENLTAQLDAAAYLMSLARKYGEIVPEESQAVSQLVRVLEFGPAPRATKFQPDVPPKRAEAWADALVDEQEKEEN